ncbi:MAG: peptidoglycan-binding protein LysM [Clostridiales bacterium]|jgi:nucleoid-associated protein YgaU|nr:peptidoglycan-binding protein LysM [Clostridiales bacterium]
MSLELIKDSIRVSQLIGEESNQTVIENDIIVPDVKPDVANILLSDGDIFVNSAEAMQDKILINGTICYKILYVSDNAEGEIKSIVNNSSFSYAIDVQNARQGMKCLTNCEIEHIECDILNGRKIGVKAILAVSGKVYTVIEQEITRDLGGLDDIQVLRDKTEMNAYIGDVNIGCTVKENMEVPAGKPTIREILRNDVKISGKDFKVGENRIIAKGEINVATLYIGDDEEGSIQFMEHEIPFTQFIDLDGVDESSICDVDLRISGVQFDAGEDNDGELRLLNGEFALNMFASAYEKRSIEVIEDAYSPFVNVILEKEIFRSEEVAAENHGQVAIKDNLYVEENQPEITELFNVISKPSLSECKVMDDKVIVEGVVKNSLLYLANDNEQPIYCNQQDIPFKQAVDVKGLKADMGCEVSLEIDHCNYSMLTGREVEIRLVVMVSVKAFANISIPLIARVSESAIENKKFASRPSITIYFAQPGDTLWKIAKKYYITIDDIQNANNLTERDSILTGQQIIIPRKL